MGSVKKHIRYRWMRLRLWWKYGGTIRLNRWVKEEDLYAPPEDAPVIEGGWRNGLYQSNVIPNWWVAYSPRNGLCGQAEGAWGDWVLLAREIIEEERAKQ